MPELTHKDLHWFHLANAADYQFKQSFYAFKTRFLHRFAIAEGTYDLQYIPKPCWNCDGTGMWSTVEECWKCAGTGVFTTKEVWLARYDLAGRIYHIPCLPDSFPDGEPIPVTEIEGLIKHSDVDPRVGFRAFRRLLLRHEPCHFWSLALNLLIRTEGSNRWLFRAVRLRNSMDLFPAVAV